MFYDYGPGVYGYSKVTIEDITGKTEKSVTLKDQESEEFIDSWAFTTHTGMISGLCHEPAFKITFGDDTGSITIDSFCVKCRNYLLPIWGQENYQGIDLDNERGKRIVQILEKRFPELFRGSLITSTP